MLGQDLQAFIKDLLAVNGRLDCFLNRLADQMANAPDLAWPRSEWPPWYVKAHEVVDGMIELLERAGVWAYWGYAQNGSVMVIDAATGQILETLPADLARDKYPGLQIEG